jgi:DsbC/DsbD-like thiol-disulfide interchange protein
MIKLRGVSGLCTSGRSIVLRPLVCFAFLLTFLPLAKAQTPSQVVNWKASLNSSAPLKHGEKITAQLQATIRDGWHVYSISQPPGGPSPTIIGVPDGLPLSQAGTIIGPLPLEAYDPNFDMKTEFYERSAAFKVPLEVTPKAKPGSGNITIKVRFQTCNDRLCLPPSKIEVPLAFRVATSSPQ